MTFTVDTSYRSPNFNDRPDGIEPSAITIHTTEGDWPSDIEWLCYRNPDPNKRVSAHYVIAPDGKIYQLVDEAKRAWHAGVGTFQGVSDWNDISIGIELSHVQGKPIPDAVMRSTTLLCSDIVARRRIQEHWIVTHRWIAPTRRHDPTDWPDQEFIAWRRRLFAVAQTEIVSTTTYVVTSPIGLKIRTQPNTSTESLVVRVMRQGEYFPVSEVVQGEAVTGVSEWLHVADGSGFCSAKWAEVAK
jgi:N-acetyl-anhydromuramyl-L-alanine amidase AmpD